MGKKFFIHATYLNHPGPLILYNVFQKSQSYTFLTRAYNAQL